MSKTANIREIARLSGVSTMTVSRVLNLPEGSAPVSAAKRQRVMNVVEQLGYRPNVHAQRLFSRKSRVLGFVVPPAQVLTGQADAANADATLYVTIAGAIEAARRHRYHIMTVVADEDYFAEKEYLTLLRNRSVDALLIWGLRFHEVYISELLQEKHDFVLLNTHAGSNRFNRVYTNSYKGSYAMAKHLVELGHERIGYIGGPDKSSIGVERRDGFASALRELGVLDSSLFEAGNFGRQSGSDCAAVLLERDPSITAIGCGNDLMAIGVHDQARKRGLSVPKDLSVTGGDDAFAYFSPRLTTFRPPRYEEGFKAAEAMILRLEGESPSDGLPDNSWLDLQLDVQLVIGESTAPPREGPVQNQHD